MTSDLLVGVGGFEPPILAEADFKSAVYAVPPHPQKDTSSIYNNWHFAFKGIFPKAINNYIIRKNNYARDKQRASRSCTA